MSYEKKQRIYKTIMLVVLVAIISFISATVMVCNKVGGSKETEYVVVGNGGDTLSRLKTVVDKYYLGEYDEEKMEAEAAKGYINGIGDEYSEYIPKDEYEQFSEDIMGSLTGIGIYYGKTTSGEMTILYPIENSVAEKAGIKSGDIIKKVDDYVITAESTTTEVSQRIKGEVGTKVTLEILRDGETKTFEIIRENVKLHYVKAKLLENNIGYISLTSFDNGTAEEFKAKLEDVISQGAKSIIIDLRNNGGGIVQEATQIANYFLEKGKTIITIKDKKGAEEKTIAEEEPITDLPLIVLVNSNTASSSEILVSALKDNERAKVVGTKTYGKGVIQNIYRLSDGSAIKLTTHEYYTAGGSKLNGIGITPNNEVELPEGTNIYNISEDKDTQLNKAIELLK